MYFVMILVVHNLEKFEDVLHAWRDAGANGMTVLPSIGLQRLDKEYALRDDMPLMPLLSSLFEQNEVLNRTVFTIVEGEPMVDQIVQATQNTLGDLDEPNSGVMAVIPAAQAYGLHRKA